MGELDVSGKLVAIDQTGAAATMHVADVAVRVPPTGTLHYIHALKELCAEHRIGLLIPLTDLDVRSLARHRDKFADAGTEVMVGSPDTVMICRDKTHTSEFFQRIGLPGIRTVTLGDFRARPFFPCFIKPIRSSASVGAAILRSEADLNSHLATFGELMLVQDYVQGAEFTLDIFCTRSGQVKCVVPRQRLSIRCGEVEKGLTVNDPDLIRAGVLIGEGLNDIWGVVNAQCRRESGEQPRFFEITPRFGGGAPLLLSAATASARSSAISIAGPSLRTHSRYTGGST
ncbi:hypothetical protein LCGC14_2083860 [marine sediment metagenome]|uniref:ATP-grasp domain-containing protein n=1 Tax=marine sediment metagenome TaxID=412755 RepID=A0A0F9HBT7_9ZZZZ